MSSERPLLYGLLPTGTVWPTSTHPHRLPVLLKSALSSTGSAGLYCPCNQGSSSFLASNLDVHLSSTEHNAFIEACLPNLLLDGSSTLPFMVEELEDGATSRFNPVKLDRRSNIEELPLPPAKRLCPVATDNNDTDMNVDRAFSASNTQNNPSLSEANEDINPPLANAIVQLHELCKTHDLSRTQSHSRLNPKTPSNSPLPAKMTQELTLFNFFEISQLFATFSPAAAMADLLKVFRISLETEADYTQKVSKGGQYRSQATNMPPRATNCLVELIVQK